MLNKLTDYNNLFIKSNYPNLNNVLSKISNVIKNEQKNIYLVGGSVRDLILWKEIKDIDICWNFSQEDIYNLFWWTKESNYWTVVFEIDGQSIEYTPFRKEKNYTNRRNFEIDFDADISEDSDRRDFTINSIYLNIRDFSFYDKFDGFKDIQNKIIRNIWNADFKLDQDPIRILRAIRFKNKFNFEYDPILEASLIKNWNKIKNLSGTRIKLELEQTLKIKNYIRDLSELDILKYIFPEFEKMRGLDQKTRHHLYDVLEHTLKVYEASLQFEEKPIHFHLGCLLHDIWKPIQFQKSRDVEIWSLEFHELKKKWNHTIIWCDIAEENLKILRFDKKTIDYVKNIIYFHQEPILYTDDMEWLTDKKIISRLGNLLQKINEKFWEQYDWFEFLEFLLHTTYCDKVWTWTRDISKLNVWFEKMKSLFEEIKENKFSFKITDLQINGNDLIKLGYQGRDIWLKLKECLDLVIENQEKNTFEFLYNYCNPNKDMEDILTSLEKEIDNSIFKWLNLINEKFDNKEKLLNYLRNNFSIYWNENNEKSKNLKWKNFKIIWRTKESNNLFEQNGIKDKKYLYLITNIKTNKYIYFESKNEMIDKIQNGYVEIMLNDTL